MRLKSSRSLRTLKDISGVCDGDKDKAYVCLVSNLRKEAIKWLNHIDEYWEGCQGPKQSSANAFILNFFNITEDNLKGVKDLK